jgi:asparagine synthase (glutamine-hydrolysing)
MDRIRHAGLFALLGCGCDALAQGEIIMCGIAGLIYDTPRSEGAILRGLRAMCEAERHRGPDGLELWTNGRVGFGMVRLAVVGSARRGRQPIRDEHGSQLIFNGELYEPAQVMASLGGRLRAEDCDGKALLHLLRARGVEGLRDVSAMFSLALYDPLEDEVLLARDAWGQKPLYLRPIDGGLAFASTVAALRAAGNPLRIRTGAMQECLIFKSVGGNHSAFEGISQIPAGGWMRARRDGSRVQGRWHEAPDPDTAADRSTEIHERLVRAITLRCSDRYRNAVFLSGGLDSSLVTAAASRHAACTPHVLTVGYDVGGWQDEHSLAVQLADELTLKHDSIVLQADRVPNLLEDTAIALEDPVHDPVVVPTLALARAAATETKVVLTGDGSDEFWAGYERFEDPTDDIAAYLERTMVFHPRELGLAGIPEGYLEDIPVPAAGSMPALDRILRLEENNRLRNYHLSRLDKLTMDAGLEARSPFLDLAVTNLALSLPAACKTYGGRAKAALIDAFGAELPSWLLMRKKQPFSVPIQRWLTGRLRDFCHDILANPNAFVRSWTDPQRWLEGLTPELEDTPRAMRIWSLLHLEIWYHAFGRKMEAGA